MLNEYALRFYAMLEQSIKIDAGDFKALAFVATYPHMDDNGRATALEAWDEMGYDILEHLREGQIDNTPEELKELFK